MAEIILDFIQCHHCGERFELDEVDLEHWKVCEKSPARAEVRQLQEEISQLPCNCNHDNLTYIPITSTELYMCSSCGLLFNWYDPENNMTDPKKSVTSDELKSLFEAEREKTREYLMKAIKAVGP